MCDSCTEILDVLATCDPESLWGPRKRLSKSEIATVCTYVQGWGQRQCMCIYKDSRNYDRFNHLIQGVLWATLELIRSMETGKPPALAMFVRVSESDENPLAESKDGKANEGEDKNSLEIVEVTELEEKKVDESTTSMDITKPDDVKAPTALPADVLSKPIINWTLEEKEHLLQFATKVFQTNFPHYTAYKHSVHSKLEEISQQEATILSVHCDINDPEIPIHLLRNVCFFCDHDVLLAMVACFINATPEVLPFCLARAMISIVSNLKLWMNVAAVIKYLVPLRTSVIRYMCKLSDKDLRSAGTRSMSEFMWTAVKDPLDSHMSFDKEGLDLAFKYFTSSTLTMRLAGIAYINNHVTIYNELANSENAVETEVLGLGLSDWLINNRIVENIFGPNLHVEIIKQSHISLNFLAMEGCITDEHVDSMWCAAQLKHCSKQVHDLLLPLIKHLEPGPVIHLYRLLCRLEPHDHTEQTLYLTSALLKVLWSNENVQQNHLPLGCEQPRLHRHGTPFTSVLKGSIVDIARGSCKGSRHEASSSERSISLDSDEETTEPPGEIVDQLALHAVKNCPESGPSDPGSAPSDVAHLHNWPDEQNSFTSSDNESDVGDDHSREAALLLGKDTLIVPRAPMSLASSDSEGRVGEVEDSGSENETAEAIRRRRSRTLLSRQHQRRLLIRRRGRTPVTPRLTGKLPEIGDPSEITSTEKELPTPEIKRSSELNETKEFIPVVEGVNDISLEQDVETPPKKRRENSPVNDEKEGKKLSSRSSRVDSSVAAYPQLDRNSDGKVYECMKYFEQMQSQRLQHPESDLMEDIMSPDEGTCSSRMSTKSEKNMADFEGEESGCEDELIQLTSVQAHLASPHHLNKMASLYCSHVQRAAKVAHSGIQKGISSFLSPCLDIESVCRPGQTLLWDLLQDETVVKLGKGLALEAEKVLSNLVCWSTDRIIRMKFIEGCLQNLANNKSIYLSLRLLPRLFGSFQQYRGRMDTHTITMWAEKEHHMMELFFKNLLAYTNQIQSGQNLPNTLYSHPLEIQVRLQFLTCIFSAGGSPDYFRLSLEQVDALWSCLASDPETADELFSWLLTQAKNKEQHALGLDALKHIFTEKLPLLQPETTSMTALNLIQQLSNITKLSEDSEQNRERGLSGMDQLWGIALRAQSTDVSMTAIQYLNTYYINGHPRTLEREEEFIQRCMTSLTSALSNLEQCEELSLVVVQRALLLLKTHLETFQRRYAYHLRMWHLEGHGICSHQRPLVDRQIPPIRVVVQPAGIGEKVILELLSSDYVADLRAEVAHWWEHFQQQHRTQPRHQDTETSQDGSTCSSSISGDSSSAHQDTPQSAPSPPSGVSPILGAMLTDGPIRVITQGQELTTDLDERTIGELGFKDMQLVFVSVGAQRPLRKREELEPASVLPPPPKEKLPAMLLLQPNYLEQLFRLIQQLGELKAVGRGGSLIPHTKGHLLSWRVWEILMMLPTCPQVLIALRSLEDKMCTSNTPGNGLSALLDPQTPHKLMYSLQIVESLARTERPHIAYNSSASERENNPQNGKNNRNLQESNLKNAQNSSWAKQFVEKGGLQHLFDIFMSGILQVQDQGIWSEWNQDCLAYLLKLIYQLGLETLENDNAAQPLSISDSLAALTSMTSASGTSAPSSSVVPRRKSKKQKKGTTERLTLPRLNKVMLTMMSDVASVTQRIVSILYDAGRLRDSAHYKIGVGGRGQVVHFAMSFLLSWALSCVAVKSVLFSDPHMTGWLHHLLLDDPEPSVRQEVCSSLYRLCLGTTSEGQTGQVFVVPLLKCLIGFLHSAKNMKPSRCELYAEGDKDKEPYGPACREYFWLVCRLFDSLDDELVKENVNELRIQLDLDGMAHQLASSILSREFLETRQNNVEDDGLFGLLNLCSAVIKHNPAFKYGKEGQEFLVHIFDCLFALPSPKHRHLPLCKSQLSRSAAYDLLVELSKGCYENYCILHTKLMQQHSPNSHAPYPWDYWPHEDGRSDCGYVGLTNLGATCYMASCMQHLYMMPQARASILAAKCSLESKHEATLVELQRMFAYLLESERKAYNPRSFCKVYTMDHQPLNTGEQKDMAEFFTDLISKLEEMTPQLKVLVKTLFCGVITNNVVSLDCPHVSRTIEEFYTVRCQVADMRNLYESLDEVTVKDTLEGDNMYTCSQCGRKVRAEKRACLKKLPRILCFNTMRYTFNMVTMMKEKVNTHFSFPLRLDMSKYTERVLMPDQYKEIKDDEDGEGKDEYDLIGITVHTGTADGGHYYSFIRDRTATNRDKWFLFNDAEVKPFDPAQIAAECFGGEMTSKTYDSVTDKFMDFSFEKTHSAYMLFYERAAPSSYLPNQVSTSVTSPSASTMSEPPPAAHTVELPKDLADWIWEDNMQFLQDKNIFEHTYFNFMWQVCGYVPQTLMQHKDVTHVTLLAAKLSTSFVLETLIHAKEKPTMVQWIELLTKLFNSSQNACEWFLEHMAEYDWWPVQILIRCPNQVVRQMFQRLCIHVINKLRPHSVQKSNHGSGESGDSNDADSIQSICMTCVAQFIKKLLSLIEHGANQHTRHLTEYFSFLLEFAKMSSRECQFLLSIESISTIINFYLGHKTGDYVDPVSDEEEEEVDDVLSLNEDKYKPASLEKMITLIATLVEKSRGEDHHLHLSANDFNAITGGKGFPFLYQQIRDNVNIRQTCNLIFSLSRWNESLAIHIVTMIFQSISQHPEQSQPFFKLLSILVEFVGGPPGMPPFTRLILQHIWEMSPDAIMVLRHIYDLLLRLLKRVAEACPQQCLEWLSIQVPRNKLAHSWVLQNMDSWVEHFLISHSNQRVRNAAAFLLVSLIPSSHFKQAFRNARNMLSPQKEISMSPDAIMVLHHIYDLLLRLLKRAKLYVDTSTHGTTKLMSYFALMTYCLVSHTEKLMFGQYFMDLWQLFQPKLSEPPIAVHQNKQALLIFWYQVCVDCPENVKLIVQNAHVTKNIAFNYILADHEDQDVMIFNRYMLPAYYGLLRLCCQQSRPFTRQLANHQNIQWAFKNITPYPAQYPAAVDELYKLMRLFVAKYPDSTEQELKEVETFKCTTFLLYLSVLDGRAFWATLVAVCRILIDCTDNRLFLVCNNGLPMLFEAFQTLHVMYHEATACHVMGELVELLTIILDILKCVRVIREGKGIKQFLCTWKERPDTIRKLLTLLNSYAPSNLRLVAIEVLKELVMQYPLECLQTMVPIMTHSHSACQENAVPVPAGPYFPRRGQKMMESKAATRPPNPFLQMTLHPTQLEVAKGHDLEYDQAITDYFSPYHGLLDMMCRVAVNHDLMTEALVNLSAAVGTEGIPLHMAFFPKLWIDVHDVKHIDKKHTDMLCSSFFFVDYVDRILTLERCSLISPVIFQFMCLYMSKIAGHFSGDRVRNLVGNIVNSLETFTRSSSDLGNEAETLNGDLLALKLLCLVECPLLQRNQLISILEKIVQKCSEVRKVPAAAPAVALEEKTSDSKSTEPQAAVADSSQQPIPEDGDAAAASDESMPTKRLKTEKSAAVLSQETMDTSVASSSTCTQSMKETPAVTPDAAGRSQPMEQNAVRPDLIDLLSQTATSLMVMLQPPPSSSSDPS